jgi:trehalose/maltose hydrolase-like predicted phosphorylase
MEVATHANSSQYFLLSSVRSDWRIGVSPGGLATSSYNGAVFFGMDWYDLPPMRFIHPAGATALVNCRYDSLPAARKIANLFGYPALPGSPTASAMYAWTAGYRGEAFGCCGGPGKFEDCLEQHATGDIAASAWWEWLVTGDRTWLKERGWPILEAVAEFTLARVTPTPPAALQATGGAWRAGLADGYSVVGVLPVDEWCVFSGCGCEDPGVTDDAQTNAVIALSLRYAEAAAAELGLASNRTALYGAVADRVRMPWNATAQRHNQWTDAPGSLCPGGIGGSNYAPTHTVCPEDVMYLSYPMAEAMNVSLETTRRDADRFLPITCKENAGMTTPIHTITLLDLDRPEEAQAEFNRSLRGACYGPFNVRNEVDKHADIVGEHIDNTHFVTGDGGFLQGVQNGFGRVRIAEDGGLWLRKPVSLPDGVGELTLRRLQWRGGAVALDIALTASEPFPQMRVSVAKLGEADSLCLQVATGSIQHLHHGSQVKLSEASAFPAKILASCPA